MHCSNIWAVQAQLAGTQTMIFFYCVRLKDSGIKQSYEHHHTRGPMLIPATATAIQLGTGPHLRVDAADAVAGSAGAADAAAAGRAGQAQLVVACTAAPVEVPLLQRLQRGQRIGTWGNRT